MMAETDKKQKVENSPNKETKKLEEFKNSEENKKKIAEVEGKPVDAKATKESKPEKENKVVLEREYVVPLRKEILKVPRYRRAKRAISGLRKFLVRHMKVYDKDERKVKIDGYLNNEIWFRGIKNPLTKVKVLAKKFSDGTVRAELAEIPEKVKFDIERKVKKKNKVDEKKVSEVKKQEKSEEKLKKSRGHEETKEDKEKEEAAKEVGLKAQKKAAKAKGHTMKGAHKEKTAPRRKALKK